MIMKIHGIVIFASQYIYYTRVFCPQCLLPKTRRIETCYQNLGLFWFYFVFTSKWLLPPTVIFKDNEWGYEFLVWHSRTFQAPPKSFRHKQCKDNCISRLSSLQMLFLHCAAWTGCPSSQKASSLTARASGT